MISASRFFLWLRLTMPFRLGQRSARVPTTSPIHRTSPMAALLANARSRAGVESNGACFAHVYASVDFGAFDGLMSGDKRASDLASSLEVIWCMRGERF